MSGFHVDPGYCGRLVFGVYNAGPATVHLARGDDCFLIWYASLDCESERYSRRAAPRDGITSGLITPISGRLESLEGLSDRIDRVVADQQVLHSRATVAITLCVTVLVLVIGALVESYQVRSSPRGSAPMITSPVVTPGATQPADSAQPEGPAVVTEADAVRPQTAPNSTRD